MRRRDRSLPHLLGHQEKVVEIPSRNCIINDGTGERIFQISVPSICKYASVDPLLHDDIANAAIADVVFLDCLLELRNLVVGAVLQLTVADAVSKDYDFVGKRAGQILPFFEALDEEML